MCEKARPLFVVVDGFCGGVRMTQVDDRDDDGSPRGEIGATRGSARSSRR